VSRRSRRKRCSCIICNYEGLSSPHVEVSTMVTAMYEKHRKWGLFLILLCIIALAGCAKPEKPRQGPLVGVIFRATYGPYTGEIERGIRDKARDLGTNLQVSFHDKQDDADLPNHISEDIIKNFKVLLLFPESKGGAVKNCIPVILQANRMNLPVILLHSGIDDEKVKDAGAQVKCEVTCDNAEGGKLAAQYLAECLKGKGKVVMMEGLQQSYTGELRRKGFHDALKAYPDIKVIMAAPALNDKSQAFLTTRKLMAENKDIGGVFTLNGFMALGVAEAIAFEKAARPQIISFDGSKEGLKALKEGEIDATITQSAYEIGQLGLEMATRLLKNEAIPPHVYAPTELLTKAHMKKRESR
jgi:ribose transport system substrate-binding protein